MPANEVLDRVNAWEFTMWQARASLTADEVEFARMEAEVEARARRES